MLGDDEQSPLERKLAEDALLRDVEPIWDALYSAVQETCEKLRAAGKEYGCRVILNDNSSRIRVIPAPETGKESNLEIRLNRDEKKVIARISPTYERTERMRGPLVIYRIVACSTAKSLCFADSRNHQLSAKEVAEHEIATRLLEMQLPQLSPPGQ